MSDPDDRMSFMSAPAIAAPDLPRSGDEWTVGDWLALNEASNGERFELIEGVLLVSPPPSWEHQETGDELRGILRAAKPREFRVFTAAGVEFDGATALIPDIVVVRRERLTPGVVPVELATLVIEIVSPSSRAIDRRFKPTIYAGAGIPYYWRIEMLPFRDQGTDRLPVVFAYELDEGDYRLVQRGGAGTKLRFASPFEVEFDPGQLLDE